MTDFMTSWVKGWMLGKYGKYNEAFTVLHPELLSLSVSLAKVIAYHPCGPTWSRLVRPTRPSRPPPWPDRGHCLFG